MQKVIESIFFLLMKATILDIHGIKNTGPYRAYLALWAGHKDCAPNPVPNLMMLEWRGNLYEPSTGQNF